MDVLSAREGDSVRTSEGETPIPWVNPSYFNLRGKAGWDDKRYLDDIAWFTSEAEDLLRQFPRPDLQILEHLRDAANTDYSDERRMLHLDIAASRLWHFWLMPHYAQKGGRLGEWFSKFFELGGV